MANDKKKAPEWEEPKLKGYEKSDVIATFRYFRTYKEPIENSMKLVEKFFNGEFWLDLAPKLPDHQIMPDTNYLEYVEKGIVNSVYSGNFVGHILPRDYADNNIALGLNNFIEYRFDNMKLASWTV